MELFLDDRGRSKHIDCLSLAFDLPTFEMEPSREQIEAILAQDGIEPMAIVGMAVRYPGEASTLSGFWDMISHSRTAHSDVPADRWNSDVWYHPNADRKGTVRPRNFFQSFCPVPTKLDEKGSKC